jgi:hypothetical protein
MAKKQQLDDRGSCWLKMVRAWNRVHDRPVKPPFLTEVMAQRLV